MQISANQVQSKKQIATLGGSPVFEIVTTGGLHIIALIKCGKLDVLGTGSHRAISRYLAEQKEPDLEWMDLRKADHVPLEYFQDLLPRYRRLTEQLAKMFRDK